MTFSSYWQKLLRINQQMSDDESQKMTITVGSFKKSLKRAYDVGRKDESESRKPESMFDSLDSIFGNKKK